MLNNRACHSFYEGNTTARGTIHHGEYDHHQDADHFVAFAVSMVSRPIWDQIG